MATGSLDPKLDVESVPPASFKVVGSSNQLAIISTKGPFDRLLI